MWQVLREVVLDGFVAHEAVEGSLLAETVKGGCTQIETSFDIESDAEPGLVAMVLRNAILIHELKLTNQNLTEQVQRLQFGSIIGASASMRDFCS